MTFKIFCNHSDLERSKYGPIWGGVWVELHDTAFPEKHWNDLSIAFVAELMDALRNSDQPSQQRRVRFYDGPFWLDLSYTSSMTIQLEANNPRIDPETEAVDKLLHSVGMVASMLVNECNSRGWSDQSDVQRLSALL